MALRCLIVDDNAEFLGAARDLLERQGIRVLGVASTSADAMQRVDELRPDVALVDIDLGEESGFELARALDESPAPVRVVLISTYAERDLAELVGASSAVGFVSKSSLSRQALDAVLDAGASASPGT